jgi:hypothetical protein
LGASGKIIWTIENTRRLKFGDDCLPLSWRRSKKPVNRKSKLKEGAMLRLSEWRCQSLEEI